jgi:ubiquinone/menaquinone biosynthesis C-methylase UbiE
MTIPPAQNAIPLGESELRAMLLEYRRENWKGIQPPKLQEQVVEAMLRGDSEEPLRQIELYIQLSSASRILDIGSGVGSLVAACKRRGLRAFGVEPDRIGQGAKLNSIQIARRRLSESVFVNSIGERLPFPDASFDVVTMNQVIEHVSDQRAVMREAARVVRGGGVIYVACPNYLRFYEPHYKIFWLPLLPKSVGRVYLRLRGRSPAMLNQITYTTNRRLRKLFAELKPEYVVIDLHREQFLRKRSAGTFAAPSTRIVSTLTKIPVLARLMLWAILQYGSVTEGGCEMIILRKPIVAPQC